MKILSIETSCDETGISLLECRGELENPTFKVLGNELSSQAKLHSPYGGVYPSLAKREHIKNLPILFDKILKKTKIKKVDAIAVTVGPGLEPALWTGIVFAQELGKKWNVPVIPVNHMEGHIISPFGNTKGSFKIPKTNFPALSLLVSGGHTELVLIKNWMDYKLLGETLDDAAGEAFDKVARMMDLPYPGGPEISKIAEERRTLLLKKLGSATARARGIFQQENIRVFQEQGPEISLPRPMLKSKSYDFSFSGLKTAVLYLIKRIVLTEKFGKLSENTKSKIALEFENAVVETLIYKTKKALEEYKANTLIIAGGVASNKHLQRMIKKEVNKKVKILFPGKGLATDNSIMIGMVGYLKYLKKGGKFGNPKNLKAEGNLKL